jgi:hypothetical protein
MCRMIEGSARAPSRDPFQEETTMLKTISAALLAVSVIAAPAFAAGAGKTDGAATVAVKTTQVPVIKADQIRPKLSTSAVKPGDAKAKALNANARMTHHRHHKYVHAHRHHHKMASVKAPMVKIHKVSAKRVAPGTMLKRG